MSIDLLSIGMRLKNARINKGLSQDEFAALTDLSRTTISNVENGQSILLLETFITIANALEISADELLVDNLMFSPSTADSDLHYLLLDCNQAESKILVQNATALKEVLKQYEIK